jgi:AcrR family transcriptional regulator
MRAIAEESGASLGLAYRYFKRKDDIVLQLYRETVTQFRDAMARVPDGDASVRIAWALSEKIRLCKPHREVFQAVVPATLSPKSGAFALGSDADDVRRVVVDAFARAVTGAKDLEGLDDEHAERIALLCFVVNLSVLFFWLHDKSRGQSRTKELIELLAAALHQGLGLLLLDEGDELVKRGSAILAPLFGARGGTVGA